MNKRGHPPNKSSPARSRLPQAHVPVEILFGAGGSEPAPRYVSGETALPGAHCLKPLLPTPSPEKGGLGFMDFDGL